MAIWLYTYGRNGLGSVNPRKMDEYLLLLNEIPIDEINILDSILLEKSNVSMFFVCWHNARFLSSGKFPLLALKCFKLHAFT